MFPCPGSQEIYNFIDPSLVSIIKHLSDQCLDLEKRVLKEIMHFQYVPLMRRPKQKNHCIGVLKFTILVDPSLVIITTCMHLVCLNHTQEQKRRFVKKNAFFTI